MTVSIAGLALGMGAAAGGAGRAVAVTGTKTIAYAGYLVDVPVGWPVFRLAAQPHRCVRYDRHAVYLGHPGPDQQCPAHLVGRTETIRMDIAESAGRLAGHREVATDPAEHELALTAGRPGLSITATYGLDPGVVERVIASVRRVPGAPGTGTRHAQARSAAPGRPAGPAGPSVPAPAPGGAAVRRYRLAAARVAHGPLNGFDTCTAPSLAAMRAWRSAFAVAGIYIGGANQACDVGNLSAQWVRQVKAMGWYLIPTYVGLQAPCDRFSARIRPRHAAAEGRAAADDAVARAGLFGLRRGAPIYFDMEAYSERKRGCRTAVLRFLDAWTRRLRASGYLPGVYSSAGSAARDLGRENSIAGHSLAKPRSIWFALWDGRPNLRGEPYVLASWWPRHRRIKQFRAARWQRHGGFRLQIDLDHVSGPVY